MIRFIRESLNVLRKNGYADIEDDSITLLYSVVNKLVCEAAVLIRRLKLAFSFL